MEPIILIRSIEETSSVPDAMFPIFQAWVQKTEHHDNRNNEKVPREERCKVTGRSYSVWAHGEKEHGFALMERLSKTDAMAIYNDIVEAVRSGDKILTINRKEYKEYVEPVEGDRDSSED